MANDVLIDNNFQHYRAIIDDIFQELHQLTADISNKKLADTVDDIRSRLNEPFLFVIVGEVKVGKSSFVNALLETDKEVCKVAPDPCTDTVQQIVYGDTEQIIPINDHLKKIVLPVDILKKIAIVDTPGTNAVIEHHTEITEKFIPMSDLIIFVFEAKNPYRQSAWQFFDFISKEWRKKVIFVLQQADLIDDEDLEVNRNGLIRYATQRGIIDPQVFTVSAKRELKGEKTISGFTDIRQFIRDSVTGGNNVRLKVQSLLDTSKNITDNIQQGIELRHQQLENDEHFRSKVDSLLNNAEAKSGKQVDHLIEKLLDEYDKITSLIQEDFEEGLGFFRLMKNSVMSFFDNKYNLKEWANEIAKRLESNLKPALDRRLREGVVNIADSIRQMADIIDIEIQKNRAGLKSNNQVFGDIAEKRQEKLDKLHANIEVLVADTEEYVNTEMLKKSSELVPNMATGGLLTVTGVLIASVIQGVVFDVTGGILSVLGLSVAGVWTAMKRKKIVKEFESEIYKGRTKLKEEVEDKMKNYIKEIRIKIDNNFLEFDAFLDEEKRKLQRLTDRSTSIANKFKKLARELSI